MSATTIAIVVGSVLLAGTWLLLVAVLRSHAELLRRLSVLEDGLAPGGAPPEQRARHAGEDAAREAADIVGETPAGDAVKLSLGAGAPRTLLAFLSTGCTACGGLWSELAAGGPAAPVDVRIVVVTKGAERESLTRLDRTAPARAAVVMSSAAFSDYAVAATPHFVLVDSERRILGRGGGTSFAQILSLLDDAQADARLHDARSTSERAARAERALADSGIGPGHPSLYPSRTGGGADG